MQLPPPRVLGEKTIPTKPFAERRLKFREVAGGSPLQTWPLLEALPLAEIGRYVILFALECQADHPEVKVQAL